MKQQFKDRGSARLTQQVLNKVNAIDQEVERMAGPTNDLYHRVTSHLLRAFAEYKPRFTIFGSQSNGCSVALGDIDICIIANIPDACRKQFLAMVYVEIKKSLSSFFIIRHSSFIIHHPSSIIHHPSFIIHHPSSIIHHPSSIIHHPSFIIHHSSFIIHHQETKKRNSQSNNKNSKTKWE